VQGGAFVHLIGRITNCLAIDGNQFLVPGFAYSIGPLNKPEAKLFGVDERENPVHRIVRRNSVAKARVLHKPLLPGLAEKDDLFSIIRPAQHSRDNEQDDVVKLVLVIAPGRATWFCNLAEHLLESIPIRGM
jgi:hypothetical protein